MKVALLQPKTIDLSPEQNRLTFERLMEGVKCDLVLLPEMFSTGYKIDSESIAEPTEGPTLAWMKALAQRHNCAVVGTVAVEQRGKFFNRLYFCLPSGEEYHYDKHHLFTFAGEERTFSAGKERIIVEWRGVRILPLVCYDLRFPVWSYLPGKVDLILYSASWAASRIGAWDTLLPARAVENQAWVVGVNRIGREPDLEYSGDSAIIDHLGRTVVDAEDRECLEVAELNVEDIARFRERFNVSCDRDLFEIVNL